MRGSTADKWQGWGSDPAYLESLALHEAELLLSGCLSHKGMRPQCAYASSFGGFCFLGFKDGLLESGASTPQSKSRAEAGLLIKAQLRFWFKDQGVGVAPLNAQASTGSWRQGTKCWVRLCNQPALGPWDSALLPCASLGRFQGLKCFPAHFQATNARRCLMYTHPHTGQGHLNLMPFLSPSLTYKHKQ